MSSNLEDNNITEEVVQIDEKTSLLRTEEDNDTENAVIVIDEDEEEEGEKEEKEIDPEKEGEGENNRTTTIISYQQPQNNNNIHPEKESLLPSSSKTMVTLNENNNNIPTTTTTTTVVSKKSMLNNFERILVWIIYNFQGMACLLPFNTYINCPDYFLRLYFSEVMSVIPSVYMIPNLLGLFFMTFFGDKLHKCLNVSLYVVAPYIFFILSLAFIPILGWIGLNKWFSFILTIVCVLGTGLSTAVLQGSIFGSSFRFPDKNIQQGVMMGNGIVGILVSLLRILTKVGVERKGTFEEYKVSATIYFCVGSLSMFIFLLIYFLLFFIPYSRKNLQLSQCCMIPGIKLKKKKGESKVLTNEKEKKKKNLFVKIKDFGWLWLYSFKLNYHNCFYIFMVFWVSLSVFPGITAIIPTSFPTSFMKEWFGVLITTLFTLFDFVGRSLPRFYTLDCKKQLIYIVCGRVIFVILFMMCLHPVWWLHHDVIPFMLMVFMAFTNGYFSTVTIIFSGDEEIKAKALEIAQKDFKLKGEEAVEYSQRLGQVSGTIVTFFMVSGISFGSWTSMILNYSQEAIFKNK